MPIRRRSTYTRGCDDDSLVVPGSTSRQFLLDIGCWRLPPVVRSANRGEASRGLVLELIWLCLHPLVAGRVVTRGTSEGGLLWIVV
jgi:hypothetical protein